MYPLYEDIRRRLGKPDWIDGDGVPRYGKFHPGNMGIYDRWALELEVRCQGCGKLFRCARSCQRYSLMPGVKPVLYDTEEKALGVLLAWGDAPWHTDDGSEHEFDGQCIGTTMCADYRPIRLWMNEHPGGWRVVREINGDFPEEEPA